MQMSVGNHSGICIHRVCSRSVTCLCVCARLDAARSRKGREEMQCGSGMFPGFQRNKLCTGVPRVVIMFRHDMQRLNGNLTILVVVLYLSLLIQQTNTNMEFPDKEVRCDLTQGLVIEIV